MPQCPVSLSTDVTFVLPAMMAPHSQISITPPGGGMGIDKELDAKMMWMPGLVTGKSKLTSSVKHKNKKIVKDGHDLGPLLLHTGVAPYPSDVKCLILTLASSRKIMFAAGMVQADGDPIACQKAMSYPMMACAEPTKLPLAFAPESSDNTVIVNMHPVDVDAGRAQIATTMVVDLIKFSMSGAGSSDPITGLIDALKDLVLGPTDVGGLVGAALDNVPGLVAAGVRLKGRLSSDYQGPVAFSLSYDQGLIGGAGVQLNVAEGDQMATQTTQTYLGGLASSSQQTTYSGDGTTEVTITEQYFGGITRTRTIGGATTTRVDFLDE